MGQLRTAVGAARVGRSRIVEERGRSPFGEHRGACRGEAADGGDCRQGDIPCLRLRLLCAVIPLVRERIRNGGTPDRRLLDRPLVGHADQDRPFRHTLRSVLRIFICLFRPFFQAVDRPCRRFGNAVIAIARFRAEGHAERPRLGGGKRDLLFLFVRLVLPCLVLPALGIGRVGHGSRFRLERFKIRKDKGLLFPAVSPVAQRGALVVGRGRVDGRFLNGDLRNFGADRLRPACFPVADIKVRIPHLKDVGTVIHAFIVLIFDPVTAVNGPPLFVDPAVRDLKRCIQLVLRIAALGLVIDRNGHVCRIRFVERGICGVDLIVGVGKNAGSEERLLGGLCRRHGDRERIGQKRFVVLRHELNAEIAGKRLIRFGGKRTKIVHLILAGFVRIGEQRDESDTVPQGVLRTVYRHRAVDIALTRGRIIDPCLRVEFVIRIGRLPLQLCIVDLEISVHGVCGDGVPRSGKRRERECKAKADGKHKCHRQKRRPHLLYI